VSDRIIARVVLARFAVPALTVAATVAHLRVSIGVFSNPFLDSLTPLLKQPFRQLLVV
jgi:hypothetical protein